MGFRDEITRRLTMINNHLSSVEKRCLSANDAQSIQVIHSTCQTINQFASDVQFGITGSVESNSMAKSLKKTQINSLLEHDLEVLKRMVEATHLTNAIVEQSGKGEDFVPNLFDLEQKIVGIKNRFSDRNTYISNI